MMKNRIVLIIAVCSAILLCGAFLIRVNGMTVNGFNRFSIGRSALGERHEDSRVLEAFSSLDMEHSSTDVQMVHGDEYRVDTVYFGEWKKPVYEVKNGTLIFREETEKMVNNFVFTGNNTVTITVPEEQEFQSVSVQGSSGELVFPAIQTGSLTIKTSSGEVRSGKVHASGPVKVETVSGDLVFADIIAGSAELSGSSSDIRVGTIQTDGDAKITSVSGTQEFSGITAKNITLESSSGEIQAEQAAASQDAKIETSSGGITVRELSANVLTAKSSSGDVHLSGIGGESARVDVRTASGKLQLEKLQPEALELNTSSGNIKCSEIVTKGLVAGLSSGDFSLTKVSAEAAQINTRGDISGTLDCQDLSVSAGSSQVNLSGALSGNTEISTSSGDVQLQISGKPEEYQYQLRSSSGSLRVNGSSAQKQLSGGDGENKLNVETTSGSVNITIQP